MRAGAGLTMDWALKLSWPVRAVNCDPSVGVTGTGSANATGAAASARLPTPSRIASRAFSGRPTSPSVPAAAPWGWQGVDPGGRGAGRGGVRAPNGAGAGPGVGGGG